MTNFVCNKCGDCCRNFSEERGVLLCLDDIERISDYLNINVPTFIEQYCIRRLFNLKNGILDIYLLSSKKNTCLFLTKNNLCKIHPVKPIQCKHSPFEFFPDIKGQSRYTCILKQHYQIAANKKVENDFIKSLTYKTYL